MAMIDLMHHRGVAGARRFWLKWHSPRKFGIVHKGQVNIGGVIYSDYQSAPRPNQGSYACAPLDDQAVDSDTDRARVRLDGVVTTGIVAQQPPDGVCPV